MVSSLVAISAFVSFWLAQAEIELDSVAEWDPEGAEAELIPRLGSEGVPLDRGGAKPAALVEMEVVDVGDGVT
jgi:hypothetical protein